MAMVTVSCVEQIGETAGIVWHVLDEQGPHSMAKLVKAAGQHRDLVNLEIEIEMGKS